MKILVLIPTKPNIKPEILRISVELEYKMRRACYGLVDTVRDMRGEGDHRIHNLESRAIHVGKIRQEIIEEYLRPHHTHVLSIDADVIRYTPRIPMDLLATSSNDVVAPLVTIDRNAPDFVFHGHKQRYYDTAGFVESGHWCHLFPPFFDSSESIVSLDGVGCFYMVPAEVFRNGGTYEHTTGYTEHFSICKKAREMGMKVLCNTGLVVEHAWLPMYGEECH